MSENNLTNQFIEIVSNRQCDLIISFLETHSYDKLLDIFGEINIISNIDQNTDMPHNKYIYRLLTGLFGKKQFSNSSIDWLPSAELIDGIANIAATFKITHIEEMYTGMGILSSMLQKKLPDVKITAADTFEIAATCNKLDFIQISKRNIDDYKYYQKLNSPHPQMVISTYYPNNDDHQRYETKYLDEIQKLISTNYHSIIMIIAPFTYDIYHDNFYHTVKKLGYSLNSYHIKALDKYFFIYDLLKKYYESPMVAHIIIKHDLLKSAQMDQMNQMNQIFSPAIIPSTLLYNDCTLAKGLKLLYDIVSEKLIRSIFRHYDTESTTYSDSKMPKITKCISFLKHYKIRGSIPDYICDMDEFIYWIKIMHDGACYLFDSREQFYNFYICATNIDKPDIRSKFSLPVWASHLDITTTDYVYLYCIDAPGNWKTNQIEFRKIASEMSEKNMKTLLASKIN